METFEAALTLGDSMNTLSKEARDLIFQMVAENPSWARLAFT